MPKKNSKPYAALIAAAQAARQKAHAPYSKFKVGAALLSSSGRIFTGCNVESSSYSLTICAERTAIFKAISDGVTEFKAIVIVSDETMITPPCGACRQVLWDLAGDIDVILPTRHRVTKTKLHTLLPIAFDSKRLIQGKRRKY